jgi:ribosomal protein L11 methyltransferase
MDPDRWLVLCAAAEAPEERAVVAEALIGLGGAAVEERGESLVTYIYPPQDVEAFIRQARQVLDAAAPGTGERLSWTWQQNEDWAERWRRGLGPRRVGRRLVITPSWVRPRLRRGDIEIVIDPEMAFGTGEHATTRGALRLLEAVLEPGDRVFDVGTGSGILAIAAARLGAGEVLAVESDPDAVATAVRNIERNGVAGRVELRCDIVDAAYVRALGPRRFDVIAANILSSVLVPLLPAFREALDTRGRAILGGILVDEAQQVADAARAAGLEVAEVDEEEEWWSAVLRPAA